MNTFAVAGDVYGIDLEMFDSEVLSAFLIDAPETTLIETGYANGVDELVSAIESLGVDPGELRHAIVSHVHIDHSGGATGLARVAPDLSVYLHESTAGLLRDPDQLNASSERAMGEHFAEFGGADPLPDEHLEPVADGDIIAIGDRELEVIHAPGHSPDHVAVWDPSAGRLFANEGIGSYYPRVDRWFPPATLPRFDVAAVEATIERLSALEPSEVALSHFGVAPDAEQALAAAEAVLHDFDERIPALYRELGDVDAVVETVRRELVDLDDDYADAIADFESAFQAKGFLHYHDLL